ncbi:MAG: heparan-alpha-glucosaminide N-acetyltransferase domain-containing protein [Bacteroidales bacterium]
MADAVSHGSNVSAGSLKAAIRRVDSIDFVRGLVMIIMALDHTRDFMHVSSLSQNPLDLSATTPLLFLTRWITHFCAPAFVFLSGTSAYISMKNRNNTLGTRRYLLTRGLWLILLEFTIINFAIWFDLRFRILMFEVIAAIGSGFIVLSFLLKVSPKVLAAAGLIIIFGHDLFSYIRFQNGSVVKEILSPLFTLSQYKVSEGFTFLVSYPFIPWFGIMLTGFAAGQLFELPAKRRSRALLWSGLIALALFIIVRLVNKYGDPSPWSVQGKAIMTILSFINTTKYAPSLLFSLMTLGVMSILLSSGTGIINKSLRFVKVYGRVPMFYFIIHLYLIHSVMLLIMLFRGYHWSDLSFAPFHFGRPENGAGLGLAGVYVVWLSIVALMFPLCRWYGNYKSAHREKKWLRYL